MTLSPITMYPALADAIAAKDFSKADAMLAVIAADAPDNPWLDYYRARVAEEKGELNHAGHSFRKLLPVVSNPKLLAKIRRGLDRIQAHHDGERQQFLAQRQSELEAAKAISGADATAIFVLEPMASEAKQACAVQLGKIMQLDA